MRCILILVFGLALLGCEPKMKAEYADMQQQLEATQAELETLKAKIHALEREVRGGSPITPTRFAEVMGQPNLFRDALPADAEVSLPETTFVPDPVVEETNTAATVPPSVQAKIATLPADPPVATSPKKTAPPTQSVSTSRTEPPKTTPRERTGRAAEARARQDQLLTQLRLEREESANRVWYYHRTTPRYDDINNIHLCIGKGPTHTWLRFKIRYAGEAWLNIQAYQITADGETFDIYPDGGRLKRGRTLRTFWEFLDRLPSPDDRRMFRKIAGAQEVTITFVGLEKSITRPMTVEEKTAFSAILDAYDVLEGLPFATD